MDTPQVGIKSYPIELVIQMEELVREIANIGLSFQCNAEYIQEKAEDLVVQLNG